MSTHGVRTLKVKVVGCCKLKDTNWFTKQSPLVCLDYGGIKFETKPCKGGHKTPYFKEDFEFTLIEGLTELNVTVWNYHIYTKRDFIGSARVKFEKVLSNGIDDSSWALITLNGSAAGEVQVIMHYSNTNAPCFAPSPMANPPQPTPPHHHAYPPSPGYYQPQPYPAYPPQQPYPATQGNKLYPTVRY